MKIVVTGGAGYVGSLLTRALIRDGHEVVVLDSLLHGGESLLGLWSEPKFRFVRGDIRDKAAIVDAARGVDAIVHLAAIVGDPACSREPDLAKSVNLAGSELVLDVALSVGVRRFVFASTCSNYGRMLDPNAPVDEDSELRPISLYAETKVAIESRVLSLAKAGRIEGTALRLSTVYGVSPRMRFDLTVNEFTLAALKDQRLVVFGEQFWRPYIHVRDVALAVGKVLTAPTSAVSGRVFNVGDSDENYRKRDLVDILLRELPDTVVEYVPKAEDPRDYRVSFERIRSELDFRATWRVPDGVSEVAALIRAGVLRDELGKAYRN